MILKWSLQCQWSIDVNANNTDLTILVYSGIWCSHLLSIFSVNQSLSYTNNRSHSYLDHRNSFINNKGQTCGGNVCSVTDKRKQYCYIRHKIHTLIIILFKTAINFTIRDQWTLNANDLVMYCLTHAISCFLYKNPASCITTSQM